jgi:hypothetical protein
MGLAPLPHPSDVLRIPEVIAIGGFATPAPLAGQLAGLAAGGFAAVMLALLVAVIGEEELAATAALTSLRPQTHFESKPPRRKRELKQKSRTEEAPRRKKEERIWREDQEEKAKEENTISNRRF